MKKFFIGVAAVVTVGALVLVGCPEDSSGGGVVDLSYVCENGTAADGNGATAGVSNCTECGDGYLVMGIAGAEDSTCVRATFPYVCENGIANAATTDRADVSNCTECESGYLLTGEQGVEGSTCNFTNLYICENGEAAIPTVPVTTENVSNCTECNDDYEIMGNAGTVGSTCIQVAFPYVCTNGVPSAGRVDSTDMLNCAQCNAGSLPGTIALNTVGSTCVAFSGCTAPVAGAASVSTIYADGTYAGCSALALAATNSIGAFSSDSMTTFTQITSGGAGSTSNAYTLDNPTDAATYAGGFITLAADTDVSGKTLRFSIMSPETGGTTDGTSMVRVYLQDGSYTSGDAATYQTETTEGIVTFTNNGTWQDVSLVFDDTYAFGQTNITADGVRVLGFAIVEDTNGGTTAGLGEQTFSIDEVRIVDYVSNCTAPATGDASVDLVWGDAVYSSCNALDSNVVLRTAVHTPTRNTQSRLPSPFTVTTSSLAGGASITALFNTLTLGSGNSVYAYAIADIPADYDATGKTLKFSVKSPATGGVNSIGVFLGDANSQTSTSVQTFTNDGTWQEISVSVDDDISGGPKTAVRRVVFSLSDTNGLSVDGLGAQTLGIDEIRFE